MNMHVLLVDDSTTIRFELRDTLEQHGYRVTEAEDGSAALRHLETDVFDVVLMDLYMPDADGHTVLNSIRKQWPKLPVIMMSGTTNISEVCKLHKGGANCFLSKPFGKDELLEEIRSVLERERKKALLNTTNKKQLRISVSALQSMIGQSAAMQKLRKHIIKFAGLNERVRISGENGTGKELVARALHEHSKRADQPYRAINCATITETLAEDFFFGHVKGAFYGADSDMKGLFEEANGGTVFLDEVADLPMVIQNKLLRFLEDGIVTRMGSHKPIAVNVRIISATNKSLASLTKSDQFRTDIFHRLDGLNIRVPSLSERSEDIPALVQHFTEAFCERNPLLPIPGYTSDAMDLLSSLHYTGNIRQLRNLVTKLCAECSELITYHDVVTVGREVELLGGLPPDDRVA